MTIPSVAVTIKDNALGLVPQGTVAAQVLFGVCSAGMVNAVNAWGDPQAMAAALGSGPLVEAAAHVLGVAGGPVITVAVNPSVSGSNGSAWESGPSGAVTSNAVYSYKAAGGSATSSVTHVGTGLATVVPSGTPLGNYAIVVLIVTAGAVATATFKFSLDGGVTYSGVLTTAATYLPAGTGLTLTFSSGPGNFVAGDTYSATSVVHGPTGTGTVVPSGTPVATSASSRGSYRVIVQIVLGGAVATATFKYSLDGGVTYNTGTITTAATVVLTGTGITLTFSGTFTAADFYEFIAVAGSAAGTGAVTVSGSPLDAYQVQVKVTTTGTNLAAATGAFQYSLDDGRTFSPVIAIPTGGTYVVPTTGLTLTFANGVGTGDSFVTGDVFQFATIGPGYTTTDLTNAWTAYLASTQRARVAHIVGVPSTATATATVAATVDTLLTAAATVFVYMRAILDGADDTDANFLTAFASFVSARIAVCVGFADLTSSISGRIFKRSIGWAVAARAAKKPLAEDLARVRSGPLQGVQRLYRDEAKTPNLDSARFTTARTFEGKIGFYITNGNLMCAVGSDFTLFQRGEVIDVAAAVGRATLLDFLSDALRVNAATGFIDERDARSIEADVAAAENVALLAPQSVSAIAVLVNRTDNLLSDPTVRAKVRVTPLGYAKQIEVEIGYFNPALSIVPVT